MAVNINQLILTGNLTADPELRFTSNGVAVATITVAHTPRIFDKQANEWREGETLFLRGTLWRTEAENAAESLTKGTRVVVVGELKQRSFTTKEGEKRTVVELDVSSVSPSLSYATATVQRTSGGGAAQGGNSPQRQPQATASDPWSQAQPAAGTEAPPF